MLNLNCIKIYSIILSVTCYGLRNFAPLIHIPRYPFVNFQNPMIVYRKGDIVKQPMKKGSFVPKNVPGVGWGGVGHVGVGWDGSCRSGVGWVM